MEVVEPGRVRHQDLVALVEECHHGEKDRLVGADGDRDLAVLVELQTVLGTKLAGDGTADLRHAVVGGVVDLALVQRPPGGGLDVLRGVEVRPPDLQVDHRLAFPPELVGPDHHLAEPRVGHRLHPLCFSV